MAEVSWVAVKDAGLSAHKNKRRKMEDCHTLVDKFGGNVSQAFFGVYDGHGGEKAAKFCETRLHIVFETESKSLTDDNWTNQETVLSVFTSSYKKTDAEMKASVPAAGSCAVTAFIKKVKEDKYLYVANVGDSRAVLSRAGKAVRLSFDHKPSNEDEKKRIEAASGFIDAQGRVNGLVAVSRAMGDWNMKGEGKNFISNEPYLSITKLESDDDFIILACDGVWDVVQDQEAVDLIRDGTLPAKDRAKKLLAHAIKAGTEDNVSVIVVQL